MSIAAAAAVVALAMSPVPSARATSAVSPEEIFARTQALLEHFGAGGPPPEWVSDGELRNYEGLQSAAGIARNLKWLDADGNLKRIASWDDASFTLFRDADSKSKPDFAFRLRPSGSPAAPNPGSRVHARLLAAATRNPADRPLAGLRIAIDPGHMGTPDWDLRTGKYIRGGGHSLSEGMLNLQTALLVEAELRALGAEVGLTHRLPGPVTPLPWETFDPKPFAALRFERSQLDPWFLALVRSAPAGPQLFTSAERNPAVRHIFSNAWRTQYFILMADLEARTRFIRDFDADIALDIHYDAAGGGHGPGGHRDGTKAYVAGGFTRSELAARADRRMFAEHLLDPVRWNASVDLSRALVNRIHERLGVPYDQGGGGPKARMVAPGVFARNLGVPRGVNRAVMSYVEVLFYNDAREFAALTRNDHVMRIGDADVPYSDRLVEIGKAISEGVTGFVKAYPGSALGGANGEASVELAAPAVRPR